MCFRAEASGVIELAIVAENNIFPKDELANLTFGPAAAAYGALMIEIWDSLSRDK